MNVRLHAVGAAFVFAGAFACGEVKESNPDAAGGGGDDGDGAPSETSDGSPSDEDADPQTGGDPTIANISLSRNPVEIVGETSLTCDASHPDDAQLLYTWQVDAGTIDGSGETALWSGLEEEGTATVTCSVDDQAGGSDTLSREVDVRAAPDALVAHYPFDGNGSDASGNEHHISSLSGPSFTQDRRDNEDSALEFAFDDVLTIPDEPAFDLSSVTLMAWVYRAPTKADRDPRIITKTDSDDLGTYTLRVIPDSGDEFDGRHGFLEYGHEGPNGAFTFDSDSEVETQRWTHVAVAADSSGVALYFGGFERASSSTPPPEPSSNSANVTIGDDYGGIIDDVRIYDKALTEKEIRAIAQGE